MSGRPRRTRLLAIGAILLVAVGVAIVIAVSLSIRVESGEWRIPDSADFVRIERRLEGRPSKTIYLERHAADLRPGEDDAAAAMSSVLATASGKPIRTHAWSGGDARWKQLVQCVSTMFAPFDVTIVDQRPTSSDFLLVMVGGRPGDIGVKDNRIAGLAPFNGGVIPRAIVFAFAAQTGNEVRATCETIAMEVGHAYGLDHEYLCKDVMTYLRGCGTKVFVDAAVPCGEAKHRACENGGATQNSFRRLVDVLGVRPAAPLHVR